MRVVHINTYTRKGGAALGTLFLHQGLLARGLDSILATRDGDGDSEEGVVRAPEQAYAERLRHWANRALYRFYPHLQQGFSHTFGSSLDLQRLVRELKPNILHVHWINEGFLHPGDLLRSPVPVVVTLRDLWFFTGGCHYTHGCSRFAHGCGKCPLLGSCNKLDLSRFQRWRRQPILRSDAIRFVAISQWMREFLVSEGFTDREDIEVISNCIPFDEFAPGDSIKARKLLGLPEQAVVVLYPSLYPWSDQRKGGSLMLEALRGLPPAEEPIILLCCDVEEPNPEEVGGNVRITCLPRAENSKEMSLRYSASDFVVVPSLEEAFGKVTAEAVACGRPVVAYNRTGAVDILEHKVNGYLAENCSVEALRDGISWAISRKLEDPFREQDLRQSMVSRFSAQAIAERYMRLYNSMLKK